MVACRLTARTARSRRGASSAPDGADRWSGRRAPAVRSVGDVDASDRRGVGVQSQASSVIRLVQIQLAERRGARCRRRRTAQRRGADTAKPRLGVDHQNVVVVEAVVGIIAERVVPADRWASDRTESGGRSARRCRAPNRGTPAPRACRRAERAARLWPRTHGSRRSRRSGRNRRSMPRGRGRRWWDSRDDRGCRRRSRPRHVRNSVECSDSRPDR